MTRKPRIDRVGAGVEPRMCWRPNQNWTKEMQQTDWVGLVSNLHRLSQFWNSCISNVMVYISPRRCKYDEELTGSSSGVKEGMTAPVWVLPLKITPCHVHSSLSVAQFRRTGPVQLTSLLWKTSNRDLDGVHCIRITCKHCIRAGEPFFRRCYSTRGHETEQSVCSVDALFTLQEAAGHECSLRSLPSQAALVTRHPPRLRIFQMAGWITVSVFRPTWGADFWGWKLLKYDWFIGCIFPWGDFFFLPRKFSHSNAVQLILSFCPFLGCNSPIFNWIRINLITYNLSFIAC